MTPYRTLVIGSADALQSPRALELYSLLESHSLSFTKVQDPHTLTTKSWDLIFIIISENQVLSEDSNLRQATLDAGLEGRFFVIYLEELLEDWSTLNPEMNVGPQESLSHCLGYLFSTGEPNQDLELVFENLSDSFSGPASEDKDLNSLADSLFLDSDNPTIPFSEISLDHEISPLSDDQNQQFDNNFGDLISHPDLVITEPLAGRETFNASIEIAENSTPQDIELPKITSPIPEFNLSDSQTIQKYAALKEREAREKEATIQVLKGQLSKLESKFLKSEAERRRLTIENEECKTQLSTVEEELSQKKFYLQKIEAQQQEELRSLNLRLDNAIFQANKSQNRLEDFRDKVRNDFVKIRGQERELFNKLELQKRDAEALLASKDEQLLNQRREMDRLQYEVETLRERMLEDTEKAEDRASRLSRALQSLKLANDMLSGLTEEVLPSAGENFTDSKQNSEDEAA